MMLSPGNRVDSNSSDLDSHGLLLNASDYFPKKACITDEADLTFPFPLISGEAIEFLGRTAENGIVALSNYRIFIQYPQSYVNLPVRMIEQADIQNYTNSIVLTCKNGTTVRCTFPSPERTFEWQKRILNAVMMPKKLEDLFAFAFYAWKAEERSGLGKNAEGRCFNSLAAAGREAARMKFDLESTWRISEINVKYEVSPTYPRLHIVPNCISDTDLVRIAEFRSSRRFPSIIWRHKENGSVIARSSQPELGFFGWRCSQDENFLQAITTACFYDRNTVPQNIANGHVPNGDSSAPDVPKLLILDARSYAAAVANRAKGGGSEYAEYYPNCEIQFMSMANIHTVRKSFVQLRQLCTSPADRPDWMSALDKTLWLHHISAIMRTTCHVISAVDVERRPVLVHCSDGWDRTTQIVALAMLMLDSHYRTIKGFQTLIEWQWLEFGHKFADRSGHGFCTDETERCPIFLQWLDCVFQLLHQYPVEFEFNEVYLIHLAHHVYSCFFGTFLCNTAREREKNSVNDRTYSLWNYLQQEADESFSNLLYARRDLVLRPDYNVRKLKCWLNLYATEFNPLSANVHPPEVICIGNDPKIGNPNLPRTRSVSDLINAVQPVVSTEANIHRTSSLNQIASNCLPTEPVADGPVATITPSVPSNNPVVSPLRQSISLPNDDLLLGTNDTEDEDDGSPNVSQSTPNLPIARSLETSKTISDGTMDRSTDTITGDEDNHTLLLERFPSSQDIHTEAEESAEDEPGQVKLGVINQSDGDVMVREEDLSRDSFMRFASAGAKSISESLMASAIFSDASALPGTSIPLKSEARSFCSPCITPTPSLKYVEVNHHSSPVSSPTRPRRTSRHLPSASSTDSVHSDMNDSFHEHNLATVRKQLGPDGLAIFHDESQIQLRKMRNKYQKEVDSLRHEVAALKAQLRHRNGLNNGHGPSSHTRRDSCSEDGLNCIDIPKKCSDTIDYGTSYGSDVSWDNIDDREALVTPWVPDQCVTNCTNCGTRFWLGKRKHHCRKCGLVFCSNCSDYQIPLPQDKIYCPVRVCRACYVELHRQNNGLHNGTKLALNRRHVANNAQATQA
ncbi:myotubularin-related protein 3-like isoform X2 [Paramacrobiotus metropolitanus]|uniref:myotubularin-related protein 3-like isoform X2 n=1 Tax=Paramacrobiotus metropolitanus TaxID=2943436 RepID=UPI002445AFBF|nr:myotubularin-related protein 3-like isoform X2 [Paramacrobiotus metropolitanus]